MATEDLRFNPFPGLRPFQYGEQHLFFGREGQSEEILRHLGEHRFLAVVGTSGSGKSVFQVHDQISTLVFWIQVESQRPLCELGRAGDARGVMRWPSS